MKKIAVIAAIFFLSGNATKAAVPPPPNEGIPRTLTFEATANYFQQWTRPLPCPTGSLRTVITVFGPAEHAQFQSGAVINLFGKDSDPGLVFRFETIKHALPLGVQIDEVGLTMNDVKSSWRLHDTFAPGTSISVEITWVDSRSFSFVVNDREKYKITLPQPVTVLYLKGVGSRTVFDKNVIQCNLVS